MKDHFESEVLGETLDDAAGEAFDKVARLIGLGYPGGPAISKAAVNGDATAFSFPRAWLGKESLDFSFSGLKTAVWELVEEKKLNGQVDEQFKADVAASFQEAVVEVLAGKLMRAYEKYPEVKEVHLVGGVSANLRLREVIQEKFSAKGMPKFRYPKSIQYCTDNAAMIAGAAYFLYQKFPEKFVPNTNVVADLSFDI